MHWIGTVCLEQRLSDVPRSTDKDMVGESKKAGKNTELSGLVSKMVKTTGEAGVDMITDLVNQIVSRRTYSSTART